MDSQEPIALEQKLGKVIDVKHRFAEKSFDDRYIWNPSLKIAPAIQRAIFSDLMRAKISD